MDVASVIAAGAGIVLTAGGVTVSVVLTCSVLVVEGLA